MLSLFLLFGKQKLLVFLRLSLFLILIEKMLAIFIKFVTSIIRQLKKLHFQILYGIGILIMTILGCLIEKQVIYGKVLRLIWWHIQWALVTVKTAIMAAGVASVAFQTWLLLFVYCRFFLILSAVNVNLAKV